MNQLDILCDSRFNYSYDNPFVGPSKKELLTKLKETICSNISSYRSVDWVNDSRCYNIPINNKLFGENTTQPLAENKLLFYHVFNAIKTISTKLNKPLNSELNKIINNLEEPNEKNIIVDEETSEDEIDEETQFQENIVNKDDEMVQLQNFLPEKMEFKSNSDLFSYDARPGKILSYQDVCELTLNLARSQLQNIIKKDDSVLFAESREKNRLITELNKYLKNSEISSKLNLQINNLSIPQLQQSLDQAKDLYETIKVTHVIEKGLDLFNISYTYIFPEGIKIPGKNKAIKLNGVSNSFKQLLFDRTSPLNIAFKNILEKNHISISDEFVVGLSSLESILKKIEIVDIEEENEEENED